MSLRILLSAFLFLICCAAPALADEAPTAPGPKDRCAVCGMFVSPYPNWIAAVQYDDGNTVYFDGPKDMFIYLFDIDTYRPKSEKASISGIYVTEYYSTQMMNAKDVYFVTGSDILGPMGNELVPVKGLEQAKTFQHDHQGQKIMQFDGTRLVEVPDRP